MKTKPITLILTLLFCLSGTIVAGKGENQTKDEFIETKSDLEYRQFFRREEGFVYRQINYKGNINNPFNIAYIGTFSIKRSDQKDLHLKLISYTTKKTVAFIGEFKLDYRSVFVLNDKLAYVRWRAKVYDNNKSHIGYCEKTLKRTKPNYPDQTIDKNTIFKDLNNKQIGRLFVQQNEEYKDPKFIWKKINGLKVPYISSELHNKQKLTPHYYTGLIFKQSKK